MGHSFAPKIDRVTIVVQNTDPSPVLVKQIGIYISDWGGGDEWTDPQEWHFTTSGQMYSGTPGHDGTRRTHGLIQMAGTEFSEHLLQETRPDQSAGPMVEYTFNPEHGSVLTRVDLRTPHDSTYACDYLRRPPDEPVCRSVDPQASVAPPR